MVAVLGIGGTLTAQWVASNRAYKLAQLERHFRLDDRSRQNREDAYARFIVAARAFPPVDTTDSSAIQPALAAVREAAAYLELHAPGEADVPLTTTLDAAQRLSGLLLTYSSTAPAAREAEAEYQQALSALREWMRNDLR